MTWSVIGVIDFYLTEMMMNCQYLYKVFNLIKNTVIDEQLSKLVICQLLKLEHVSRLDIMIFNLDHFVRKLWLYLENTAIVVSVDSSSNFNLTSFFT